MPRASPQNSRPRVRTKSRRVRPPASATVLSSPRWRRRKDARPQEIVAAALAAFADRGFAATRLEDVARRAGVSKGTVYLYFRNKEDLFKAVVRGSLLPNLAVAEGRLDAAVGPTADALREILAGLVGIVANTRLGAIPKLVIAESGNFPALAKFYGKEVAARGLAMFERVLARGVARGEFRAIDAAQVAFLVAAPIVVTALWKNVLEPHTGRRIDAAAFAAACADVLLHGLERPPGKRS